MKIGIGLPVALGAAAVLAATIVALPRPTGSNAWAAPTDPGPVLPTVIGMTLGNPSYWSAEWAFDDPIQSTMGLKFIDSAGRWQDFTDQLRTDAGGHPVGVPSGTKLAVMIQSGSERVRTGKFACRISKGWSIRPLGNGWQLGGGAPDFTITITDPHPPNGVALLLTATKDTDLTTLACRPDGAPPGRVFYPPFLDDIGPYRVLRFMDWQRINSAPMRRWSERATPASLSQAGPQGVAIEHIVSLANTARADPWINLPLDADPDYYRELATFVRDHLSPDRRVYVELSNEVWNTAFAQGKAAVERGRARYPDADPALASDFYYADRVREAMAVWSQAFAGQSRRLVRVLASQAANPRRAERALSHNDTWRSVDALATAPYFATNGNNVAGTGAARIDAVFAAGPGAVDEAISQARAAKAIARARGLRYISYEGGPGYVGYQPGLREDMEALNRDPRMHDLYLTFLKRWQAEIGDLFVAFDATSTPHGGSFGHRTWTGQPLADAPKARAIVDFVGQ